MPTPTKGARLGGTPAHQRLILANLASQLFEHGRITTTETKAKRVQPLAETLITKAKRGDLHARRLAAKTIRDKGVLHVLFTEIAPMMDGREGGYTRITKIGNRKGDNAPMAIIELVTESVAEGRANRAKTARKAGAPTKAATKPAAMVEDTSEPTDVVVDVPAEDTSEPTDIVVDVPAEDAAEAAPQEALDAAAERATDVAHQPQR